MSRAFVLGSGFSTYAGAPLSRTVLPAIFSPDRQGKQVLRLKTFLGEFLFKGQADWVHDSGLEEVLSRLDLIRHYQPYPNIDYNQISLFEEILLGEFTRLLAPENTDSYHTVYRAFGELVNPGDTIISFNYDLIVENLLTSSGSKHDYCLKQEKSQKTLSVNLLKLHGSINLYYCPHCGEIYHFSDFITGHPLPYECKQGNPEVKELLVCKKCTMGQNPVRLRHFIIAPTLFKSYALPALRNLWFKAMEVLKDTDEIYFIGYSLPEADILSYQLFDFGRRSTQKKQAIHLISGPRLASRRFEQIYGSDLMNTGLYLEEWVRDHIF